MQIVNHRLEYTTTMHRNTRLIPVEHRMGVFSASDPLTLEHTLRSNIELFPTDPEAS